MNIATSDPKEIIAECTVLYPQNETYLNHLIIERFGSPLQPIYVDQNAVEINGLHYQSPLILPIYNAQLDLIQCAVMQDSMLITIMPDGMAKGFAYYGELRTDQAVIITYDLEAFFKIAQTGYAVVLVVLPHLCSKHRKQLKSFDFKQIEYVVNQLAQAGYTQLYMPVRSDYVEQDDYLNLEQTTAVRLLSQCIKIDGCDNDFLVQLSEDESGEEIKAFLDEAIEQLPPQNALPKGHLAKPFKLDDGAYLHILDTGLYLLKEKQDENGETKQTRSFISHSAIVLGEARSQNNDNWKRVLQFQDKDHQQHTLLIPYEHFMGDAQEALKIIANHGLMPPRQSYKKSVFIHYIQDYPIERRFRCVDRTGWHGSNFVTPNNTYGQQADEELLYQHEGKNPYTTQGNYADWQELCKLVEPHALAVLSFSCAFAGQLVSPLNVESGGFHIYGSSTDGKSTITKASCSVWGSPKSISKSWRTTDNALENEAELRNDNFLNLDELRQAVPRAVSDIIYMLTGGQGKARSSKVGKNKESKQFSLIYSSTGEVTLEEHLRRGNIELDAGLLLRFAHLPSDAGKGYGVFESINYGTTPQDVGNRINALSSSHYGHAGKVWLEYLTSDFDNIIEQAKGLFEQFIQQHSHKLNAQASRVLQRFALVATAGELATQAGITTWTQGRAFEAVGQCFKAWLSHLGNGENVEETKILEHIKAFFEANGSSRFENLTVIRHADGEVIRPRIHNQVGYYDPDEKVYLVSSIMFKKEMCIGFNEANAKKVLKQQAWLDCDDGRYTKRVGRSVLPNGERPTMMHFKADIIQNFENEEYSL